MPTEAQTAIREYLALAPRLTDAQRERAETAFTRDYPLYHDDPVLFGRLVLGHRYTPDVERLMQAILRYPATVAKSGNATGKSYAAADVCLWWLLCRPDAYVLCSAAPPIRNLRDILWRHILAAVRGCNLPVSVHPWLLEYAGGRIVGRTIPDAADDAEVEASFSGHHAPNLLFVLDEADAIPAPCYRGIESCMSGTGTQRLLAMYNPRTDACPLGAMEREGRAHIVTLSALNHPNVTGEGQGIPGAVSREVTVRRINEWSAPVPDMAQGDLFDVPACLVGAVAERPSGGTYGPLEAGKRRITDPQLAYMVLARYPLGGVFSVFDAEYLRRRRDEVPDPEAQDSGLGYEVAVLEPGMRGLAGQVTRWDWPIEGERYVLCVDPHGGMQGDELDYTSGDIVRISTGEQVLHYHGRPDTQACAYDVRALSQEYNGAVVIVLCTGVGLALLMALRALGCPLWSRKVKRKVGGRDVTTSEDGMPASMEGVCVQSLVSAVKRLAAGMEPRFIINGVETIDEMVHYVELPGGKQGGEGGWHDDRVRSLAPCCWFVSTQTIGTVEAEEARYRAEVRRSRVTGRLPVHTKR